MFAPGEADESLVRFALVDDADSERHRRRWRELVELDDAPVASHQLLPTAYLRMEAMAPDDRDIGRLRGIYRQRWAAARQHHGAAERAIDALIAHGIAVIGPPDQQLAASVTEPLVLPIDVPRLTVRERSVAPAIDVLRDAGWQPAPGDDPGSSRRRLVRRDWPLRQAAQPGLNVVVGVDVNPSVRDDAYARSAWDRAAVRSSGRSDVGAGDLLLAALSDGPGDAGSLRWAIGSTALARATAEFHDAEGVFSTPAVGWLLPCLVSRMEFLLSVDPNLRSLERPLAAARSGLESFDRRSAPPGALARQAAHRSRQARALVAGVRRHGGVRRAVADLLAPRRLR